MSKNLGLDRALSRALRSDKREIDVEALVRAMVFNRLCDPAGKLGCLRWLETVAMPAAPECVTHRRLLRATDALTALADQGGQMLEFILAVPARRYGELVETFRDLAFDAHGLAEAALFDGKLALLTNAPDLRAADAVARHKALADIERGFRVLTSDIEIAPVHHRLPNASAPMRSSACSPSRSPASCACA